ncbi:MAG TPA: hypothetical protein VNU22_13370 [Candidatus Acidoferrum sp.]|jgi:hypothetical protein|nr:hypothetical protein [Candidatus Acidoferrum sp.]
MFHGSSFKPAGTVAVGAIAVGIAVAISSFGVVRAAHFSPDKKKTTFSCSSGTACLTAESSGGSTYALYAQGVSANTIQAETSATNGDSAIAGIATEMSGRAEGVYAASNSGDGLYAITNASGGSGAGYAGVYGLSSSANGVLGEISSKNPGYVGVEAVDDGTNGDPFLAFDLSTDDGCAVDPYGNLTCSGTIGGAKVQVRQRSSSGRHVLSYASQSATATIEDVGTGRMYGGVANVQISPDFASVMDGKWYYVFLTPLGDTRGLYVSVKMASGFQVKETERGRDSLEFDYRIVAHPLGSANDRLPPAPRMTRPAEFTSRH